MILEDFLNFFRQEAGIQASTTADTNGQEAKEKYDLYCANVPLLFVV